MIKSHRPVSTLEQVRAFLERGEPQKALEVLDRTGDRSLGAENARAVCLMRLGHADRAVSIYQGMVLRGSVSMDEKAPVPYVVNFATALLLTGNVSGAVSVLDELHQPDHASVIRLRGAITRWRKSLGIVRRLLFAAYGTPQGTSVVLDFPPGEV